VTGLVPCQLETRHAALALATLGGAWRPAAQAMRVDPVALLREE
jgi:hypothetical protein